MRPLSDQYIYLTVLISGRLVQDEGDPAEGPRVDPERGEGVRPQGEGWGWVPHWHEVGLHEQA